MTTRPAAALTPPTRKPNPAQSASVPWTRPKGGAHPALFAALAGVLLLALLTELAMGTVNIPLTSVAMLLLGRTDGIAPADADTWRTIVLDVRLPRALTAMVAGAALAVAGLQLQTLFRNPLAGPWVLGLTAGAKIGVALVILASGAATTTYFADLRFLGNVSLVTAASVGAAATLALILLISRRVNTVTLLVVGVMLTYLIDGTLSVMTHMGTPAQARLFSAWNDGNFGGVTWERLWVLLGCVAGGLSLAILLVKPLNALLLGERYARTMGLSVERARLLAFGSSIVLSGSVTAYCGPVLFLDLAVPHLCRGVFNTSDHRVLVPACVLLGATLALAADMVMHLPGNVELMHLNAILAIVGAPVVLWVLLQRRQMRTLEL